MARKLRYFATRDPLGFPIPSTLRGYVKDPCKCELVEILGGEVIIPDEEFRRYHPDRLHYFYQVTGPCCDVVPNSLIISRIRPRGKYREFYNVSDFITFIKTEVFFKDDCTVGTEDLVGAEYSKTYKALTQDELDAKILADEAVFDAAGQANANDTVTCTPE